MIKRECGYRIVIVVLAVCAGAWFGPAAWAETDSAAGSGSETQAVKPATQPAAQPATKTPAAGGAVQPASNKTPTAAEEMILFQDLPSVFGASKYEQKPSEAPASISVITAEEIDKYGYRTLGEALSSVRGIFTTYDRNYTYIGVRGFDRPGDFDTRLLLLVDGHRINDNIYGQATVGYDSVVDIHDVERIEVIRGPSSSLYGTNAFLAVINVITRSGRTLKGGEVIGGAASYGTGTASLAWGTRTANGTEAMVSGTYYDSQGQNLFYPEYDDPLTNDGMATNVDWESYSKMYARVEKGNGRLQAGLSYRDKGVPTGSYGTTFDDPSTHTIDARGYVDFKYDREVSERTRFVGSLSYDNYRYSGEYGYPGSLFKDYGYGQWWTGEGRTILDLGRKHKVIGGVEYRLNTQIDQKGWDEFTTYFQDSRTSGIWAVYAQDEYRISDGVILNLGVRHDNYDTFGGTTNPRVALIFGLPRETTMKLLYGKAFRAPNAYELYYEDGISQLANPDLQPERITTYELVVEHQFRLLRGSASIYRYGIDNLISQTVDTFTGFNVFENVDRVNTDGIELDLEGRLYRHVDGGISYSFQDAEDATTGDRLTNSPKHLAKLNLSIPFSKDRFSAGLQAQYMSSRVTTQATTTPGYVLTNLILTARPWKTGMNLRFGIYNLFDKEYGDPGGEELLQSVIPQDGRNYRFELRYEF